MACGPRLVFSFIQWGRAPSLLNERRRDQTDWILLSFRKRERKIIFWKMFEIISSEITFSIIFLSFLKERKGNWKWKRQRNDKMNAFLLFYLSVHPFLVFHFHFPFMPAYSFLLSFLFGLSSLSFIWPNRRKRKNNDAGIRNLLVGSSPSSTRHIKEKENVLTCDHTCVFFLSFSRV